MNGKQRGILIFGGAICFLVSIFCAVVAVDGYASSSTTGPVGLAAFFAAVYFFYRSAENQSL